MHLRAGAHHDGRAARHLSGPGHELRLAHHGLAGLHGHGVGVDGLLTQQLLGHRLVRHWLALPRARGHHRPHARLLGGHPPRPQVRRALGLLHRTALRPRELLGRGAGIHLHARLQLLHARLMRVARLERRACQGPGLVHRHARLVRGGLPSLVLRPARLLVVLHAGMVLLSMSRAPVMLRLLHARLLHARLLLQLLLHARRLGVISRSDRHARHWRPLRTPD